MKTKLVILMVVMLNAALSVSAGEGKHLFILSGQSNMQRLDPGVSFSPALEKEFGKENVIVVKDAKGAQPIRRWYKDWKPAKGDEPKANPGLYDSLMKKVNAAIADQKIASVTFVWMQGERDAREEHGEVYEASFKGLVDQIKEDLKRDDVNFVIGRLSDFDMENAKYPHWTMLREVQVKLAEENKRGEWVDTDDLNNHKPDQKGGGLHYTEDGYKILGERFAEKAIALVKGSK